MKYVIYGVLVVILYLAVRFVTVGDSQVDNASYWFGFLYGALCSISFRVVDEFFK